MTKKELETSIEKYEETKRKEQYTFCEIIEKFHERGVKVTTVWETIRKETGHQDLNFISNEELKEKMIQLYRKLV